MRTSVLAVSLLLSVVACNARDTAPTPVVSSEPDTLSASIPVPAVPQISQWELDPENSSAEFVCKHVFSKVRGMFAQPSGTVMLDLSLIHISEPTRLLS